METKSRSKTNGTYEKSTTSKATKSPTLTDLAWAAGIIEGEGSFVYNAGSQVLSVPQKDPWILYRMQELFGGNIRTRSQNGMYSWAIYGTRARGVIYTLFKFLSPRRKAQAKAALFPPPEKAYKPNNYRRRLVVTPSAELEPVQCQ